MGILRLSHAGFVAMPRALAVAVAVGGLAVVAFGIVLAVTESTSIEATHTPLATLEPVTSDSGVRTQAGTGIAGRVTNSDGRPTSDVAVTLTPLFDQKGTRPLTETTDAKGAFAFNNVHVDPGSPWVAEAAFDGARFPSGVLRAPIGRLKIVVAPTTRSDKDIRISSSSLAVVGDKTGAQAVQAIEITNRGTKAFVGRLVLPLLPGATVVQEGEGLDRRYLSLEEGTPETKMVSTAPLLPGPHSLTYTYGVQLPKDGVPLDDETLLATHHYELLVGGDLTARASGSLQRKGEVKIGHEKRRYERFVATGLEPGERVATRITVAKPVSALRTGGLAGASLLALTLLAVPLLRRRRTAPAAQTVTDTPSPTVA